MKRFLKFLGILILLILISFSFLLFTFRQEISLLFNISEKYKLFLQNNISADKTIDLNAIDSMDYKDIVYKNTADTPLTLDIYGPKNKLKPKSPVILYVHGGSWVYGDNKIPQVISPMLEAFREEGFTIISTNYQLMKGKENFSKQVCDVKDTIRWIHKNKDIYNFDINNIGLLGVSSGAHLSLMACYSDNSYFQDDISLLHYPSKVKYIIDFAGPTDLKTLNTDNVNWDLKQIIKSSVPNKNEILENFSPLNYIDNDEPTTLIIHSRGDSIVPYENASKLYDKLNSKNSNVEFLTLEGSSHDFSQIKKEELIPIGFKILKFISKNLF